MPDTLNQWAARWRIPDAALVDLRIQLTPAAPTVAVKPGSEADALRATIESNYFT